MDGPSNRKSPSQVAAAISCADSPSAYECARCHCREDVREPDWADPNLPRWNGKREPPDAWRKCPSTGPAEVLLTHPTRTHQRLRKTYTVLDKPIRACIKVMLLPERVAGRNVTAVVMEPSAIWRELYLKEHLKAKGLASDLDIALIQDRQLSGHLWWIDKYADRWFLPVVQKLADDEWSLKLRELQSSNNRAAQLDRWAIARAIEPLWNDDSQQLDRVLYVPVDLARSIREQIDVFRPRLTEIRDYLHRFAKGKKRRQQKDIWRRVYIYVLSQAKNMSAAEIAKDVFPQEKKEAREIKTRKILRDVQKAVKRAKDRIRWSRSRLSLDDDSPS